MYNFEDLTGQKFGLLTVVERVEDKIFPSGNRKTCWRCVDHEGNVKFVTSQNLKRNNYDKVFNLHKKVSRKCEPNKYPKRLIRILQGMKARCLSPKHQNYHNYGGRGITICQEWLHDSSKFYDWAMANGYNSEAKYGECTIDRIDKNGNYSPENCRWVTLKEQCGNLRKNTQLTLNGETHCISEWARILNIPKSSLQHKIKTGKINEILK